MGVENPGNPPGLAHGLWALEMSFLGVYAFEMAVKLVALGAVQGPNAYFKNRRARWGVEEGAARSARRGAVRLCGLAALAPRARPPCREHPAKRKHC